jgi:hypothetical protein
MAVLGVAVLLPVSFALFPGSAARLGTVIIARAGGRSDVLK